MPATHEKQFPRAAFGSHCDHANLFGPCTKWHEAVPCGGGTDYFQDKAGNWWCAFFGNDNEAPFREKPAIVKIDFADDGKIVVAKQQPEFVLQK